MLARLKILPKLMLIIATVFPVIWLFFGFLLAFRAWMFLGYWPEPNYPDPMFIPFNRHLDMLGFGSFFLIPCTIVFFLFFIYFHSQNCAYLKLLRSIHVAGWLGIIVFTFMPVVNFVAWFMD